MVQWPFSALLRIGFDARRLIPVANEPDAEAHCCYTRAGYACDRFDGWCRLFRIVHRLRRFGNALPTRPEQKKPGCRQAPAPGKGQMRVSNER